MFGIKIVVGHLLVDEIGHLREVLFPLKEERELLRKEVAT